MKIKNLDLTIIDWLRRTYIPVARVAIFIVYFWFGVLKITDSSPATPLAVALINKTVGLTHFHGLFIILGVFECLIGVLFLFPKTTRLVIPLLLLHLIIVCSPLLLVPQYVWVKPLQPTLEGQYIIKNLLIIAVAIGIAAHTTPLSKKSK